MDLVCEYNAVVTNQSQIDITDIGNCALMCTDAIEMCHCIIIITEDGITKILKFGPFNPDIPTLLNGYVTSFTRIDYNDKKISNEIRKFLSDTHRNIVNAKQIDIDEALGYLPDINEVIRL